jgi:Fe-S cluster biogenesis protein NfuA
MIHFGTGEPVVLDDNAAEPAQEDLFDEFAEPEVIATIKEMIEARVRPAVTNQGGDVVFRGFKHGVVFLEMLGAATGLRPSIEQMLRHFLPEVTGVADYRDAVPKPGLETEDGKAIRRLLDENINPQVASHGGYIALVDVQDDTVYVRLEGGCQGCGMADVTLKQGVANEIKNLVPSIAHILDVTDHAGGTNPYYQPGKGA